MSSKTNFSNGNSVVDSLTELALNLDWSWSHSADDLWRQLDHELWELTHNPWVILQTISRERLEDVTSTQQFRRTLDQVPPAAPGGLRADTETRPRRTCLHFSCSRAATFGLHPYLELWPSWHT
jgi:hypothetical protein